MKKTVIWYSCWSRANASFVSSAKLDTALSSGLLTLDLNANTRSHARCVKYLIHLDYFKLQQAEPRASRAKSQILPNPFPQCNSLLISNSVQTSSAFKWVHQCQVWPSATLPSSPSSLVLSSQHLEFCLPGMKPSVPAARACALAALHRGEQFLWSQWDKGSIKAAEAGINFPALNLAQALNLCQAGTRRQAGQTNPSSLRINQRAGSKQGKLTQAQHPPKVTAGHPVPRPAPAKLMGISLSVPALCIHQVKLLDPTTQTCTTPDHPAGFWALKGGISASSLLHGAFSIFWGYQWCKNTPKICLLPWACINSTHVNALGEERSTPPGSSSGDLCSCLHPHIVIFGGNYLESTPGNCQPEGVAPEVALSHPPTHSHPIRRAV